MNLKSLFAISLLFVGCTGTGRFNAMKEGDAVAAAPKTFMIKEVIKKEGVSESVNSLIAGELETQFRAALVREKLSAVESQPDVSIAIQIEKIRPGNAAVRYFFGPFFGKGEVSVLIKTTDKDGKEWFVGEGNGTVIGGGWGGKIQSACKRIAVAYVKEYRKRLAATPKVAGN